jgi:Ku70/Ku80 beta-barrel domain/Ku70/Ku80 N-terminal alpha/beta domain
MKQAVVFILDANPSMNLPYPSVNLGNDDNPTTRLECAKLALESMISELILQSKTNEVSVIVCKTADTKHHKIASTVDFQEEGDDLPFCNLTELTPGVVRPGTELLRSISQVETVTEEIAATLQGDICDAFMLAADALYERGTKYKFERKIVLITDAEHDVVVDFEQMRVVIDALRNMSCRFEVIGLEFASSAVFDEPSQSADMEEGSHDQSGGSKRIKREDDDGADVDNDEGSMGDQEEETEIISRNVYSTKQDREQFLSRLAEYTGGSVIAAATMQQVLDANRGKRVQNSVKTKFEFRIAPGLAFQARYCLLMSKQSFPTLKTLAVVVDDTTGRPRLDDNGQEITCKIQKTDLFVDPDEPDDIVDEEDRAKAIQFGSTLVPMSSFDFEGLKPAEMGARMEVLGYVERDSIPAAYMSGPPSVLTGHDSKKACAGISALAQALEEKQKVAIATFYKRSTSKKPVLVALFPLNEPEYPHPIHLVLLHIPFDREIKQLGLDSLTPYLEDDDSERKSAKEEACDDLIDSLMLPDDVLCSGKVPSPLLRSFNQTKIKRAMDPLAPVVKVRPSPDDQMVTPADVLRRAKGAIKTFETTFVGTEKKNDTPLLERRRNGRKVLTYKDYL